MGYVILVGAYERDNFGDIACSEITAKVLHPLPVLKTSMLSSDVRALGGDLVVSVGALKRSSVDFLSVNAVVFCGGETLACDASSGLAMNLPKPDANALLHLPVEWQARALRATVVDGASLAYVLQPDEIPSGRNTGIPLIYHSVGGTRIAEFAKRPDLRQRLQTALGKARYVCVRDAQTRALLSDLLGIDAQLCPDAGFALRRVLGDEIAVASQRESVKSVAGLGRYIVFQANVDLLSAIGLPQAADRLGEVAERTKTAIVLQPSGTAFAHDSLQQLTALGALIREGRSGVHACVQRDRNFLVQAAVIGHAVCWIGSSLHGRIAAISMRVPTVSFANPKVKAEVETWETEPLPYEVGWDQLADATQSAVRTTSAFLDRVALPLEEKAMRGLEQVQTLASGPQEISDAESTSLRRAVLVSLVEENRHLRTENLRLTVELNQVTAHQRRLQSIARRLTAPVRAISRMIFSFL